MVVQVRRNKHAPRFEEDDHSVSVREDMEDGGSVVRMRARDEDSEVGLSGGKGSKPYLKKDAPTYPLKLCSLVNL